MPYLYLFFSTTIYYPSQRVTKYLGVSLEFNKCFSSLSHWRTREATWKLQWNTDWYALILFHITKTSHMHLEEDVLFPEMPNDWLKFYLKTTEWHKKYDFYRLANSPRSWFPSKCSFSDHRRCQFNLPRNNSQRKQAASRGIIQRQVPRLLLPTYFFLSLQRWGLTECCYSRAASLLYVSLKRHLCST